MIKKAMIVILLGAAMMSVPGYAGQMFLGVDFEETPKWEYTSSGFVHALNHGCRFYSSRHAKISLKKPYLGFKEMELSSGNSYAAIPAPSCPLGVIALERYAQIKDLDHEERCAAVWTSNAVERLTMEYGVTMLPREDFARELCGTNAVLEFRCGTSVCTRTIDDNPSEQTMHYYIYVRSLNVPMWYDIPLPSQNERDAESRQSNSPKADIEVEVDI